DGRVYFAQSERWPLHYPFARAFLWTAKHPIPSEEAFGKREYRTPDRRFVLGTIARYADAGAWALELYAGDALDLDATAAAFRQIREKCYFKNELRYRPVPAAHVKDIDKARALMPVVTTEEIFGKINYQPLELGEAYGYLRVVMPGTKLDIASLRAWDIVVLG